ncbi:MAG: rhomboid family intramembrane serine protease [Lachnospiraceae bacterium]|nr:rhomboid family intramembrane serine protease [Lachnospiraceae bacterium]
MSSFERKFGKYAIRNLSVVLVACYAIGYVLEIIAPWLVVNYLTLNPYAILHGQIWRLVTWVLIPPSSSNIFFTLLMLYFYCSIGTTLERTWGTYRYNVYIFSGILFTIAGSFLFMAFAYLYDGNLLSFGKLAISGEQLSMMGSSAYESFFASTAPFFNTYYINMSIFLAFAATFPDVQVLLMFIIPVKVKWLGVIYAVMLAFSFLQGDACSKFAIVASLLNFVVFFLTSRNMMHLNPKQIHRRQEFKRDIRRNSSGITKHKCAICGRTEQDSPEMQFRFCSKCDGNYEYCEEHLYTHTHVKRG